MGLERNAVVRVDRERGDCKVLLEADGLILRGAIKRQIAPTSMTDLKAADGQLSFQANGESVRIELGDDAEKWLDRILNPRSRCQKLGVKVGQHVCLLGEPEDGIAAAIEEITGTKPFTRLQNGLDLVLLFVEEPESLDQLKGVAAKLEDKGAVWVIFPKGRRDLAHEPVVAAGRKANLSLSKSMAFSDRLTGIRLSPARKK